MRKKYEVRRRDVRWTIEPSMFQQNRASAWHATRSDQEPSIATGSNAVAVLKALEESGVAASDALPLRLYDWNEVSWP